MTLVNSRVLILPNKHTGFLFFAFQLYDMYSCIMQYLPGRHNRIYYLVEDLKDFIAGKIKINQATLDPSNPRDFIDCFLIQMEKVPPGVSQARKSERLEDGVEWEMGGNSHWSPSHETMKE